MKILSFFKQNILMFLRPEGKQAFLKILDGRCRVLDVGCGNNQSVQSFKMILPGCSYTGIDVGNYNQTKNSLDSMDEYIVVEPSKFGSGIADLGKRFDAVISCHNLEHCDNRSECLESMMESLVKGGRIYLSFPSEKSVGYPSRSPTLSYYDDPTHKEGPPNFENILEELNKHNFKVTFAAKRYQPLILRFIGFIMEPISMVTKRISIGTWELYGFESVIHASKMD